MYPSWYTNAIEWEGEYEFRSFGDDSICQKENIPPAPVIHKNIDPF